LGWLKKTYFEAALFAIPFFRIKPYKKISFYSLTFISGFIVS
jgi:hypothetical protein